MKHAPRNDGKKKEFGGFLVFRYKEITGPGNKHSEKDQRNWDGLAWKQKDIGKLKKNRL